MISIVAITSCQKSNTSVTQTWTFQSKTYSIVAAYSNPTFGEVIVNDNVNGTYQNFDRLTFNYVPGTTLPGGTYTVAATTTTGVTPPAGQININFQPVGATAVYYNSNGGNGSEKITVTTAYNGKITLKGSGITLVNSTNPADSGTLSFTFSQTN
jgi:hypothetical protein